MPRSASVSPAPAVLLFAAATALGFTFTPSAAGLVFAAVPLMILSGALSVRIL
jgi:Ca2+:H+ antiporter